MIEVKNLSYRTKTFSMENISFSLDDGYLMTLLGKNGAGKTTLLDLLYGRLIPLSGKVLWNGCDATGKKAIDSRLDNISDRVAANDGARGILYHEEVAYVGGRTWCIGGINVDENVDLLKQLYSRWDQKRFEEILEMMEFTKEEYMTKFEELSTGKQMQFQLAFALARHPKLLLLDEPMANLDPVVKTDLWELLIRTIEKENISIIISTHLVEEVNDITDYIGVIDNGKLVKFGDREQILNDDLGNETKDLRALLEAENG
ncbi:ATP-binding cassette domain-containing protein [Agathobacter sp.]